MIYLYLRLQNVQLHTGSIHSIPSINIVYNVNDWFLHLLFESFFWCCSFDVSGVDHHVRLLPNQMHQSIEKFKN